MGVKKSTRKQPVPKASIPKSKKGGGYFVCPNALWLFLYLY
jgi:hypothetical protein